MGGFDDSGATSICGGVRLSHMLKSIKSDKAVELQKKIKKLSRKKVVEPPLEKVQSDLIERKLNFDKASKEVAKWDPIVKERSKASQLKFPLQDPVSTINGAQEVIIQSGEPKNELEAQVFKLLQSSDAVLHDDQELTRSEEKFMKAISLEEAKSRHRELQKMRSLISHQAAKMKRQKAIKSKSYRRILKHERIRTSVKKFEENMSNKEVLMDEIRRLERLRARERATLKHKNTGKWAKHVKIRAKFDEQARQAMIEQIGLAEKNLKKTPQIHSPDSSESEVDSESEDEGESESVNEMDDQEDGKNDDQEIEQEEEPKIRDPKNYNPWLRSTVKSGIDDDDVQNDRNLSTANVFAEMFQGHSKVAKGNKPVSKERDELMSTDDEDDEDDDAMMSGETDQRKLMSEAFADDDVVEDFKKTKEQLANEEQPKDLDFFLPGWGGWAGPGIKQDKKRREKFIVRAKRLKRRDDKLGNVIISEKADGKIKQYMVKKVPYPMRTTGHFEEKIKNPISDSFRDQVSMREKTKFPTITRMGAKIDPMDEKELRKRSDKVKFDI